MTDYLSISLKYRKQPIFKNSLSLINMSPTEQCFIKRKCHNFLTKVYMEFQLIFFLNICVYLYKEYLKNFSQKFSSMFSYRTCL